MYIFEIRDSREKYAKKIRLIAKKRIFRLQNERLYERKFRMKNVDIQNKM